MAADTVTLVASVGTVVKNAIGTWDWSINTTAPVSNQPVTITASDEDGGTAFVTFTQCAQQLEQRADAYLHHSDKWNTHSRNITSSDRMA